MRGRQSCKYVTGGEEQLVKFQLVRKVLWKGQDERKHASIIQIKVSINGAMLFWASRVCSTCTIIGVQGSRVHLPATMGILGGHTRDHDIRDIRIFLRLRIWQSFNIKFSPWAPSSGNNSYRGQNNHRLSLSNTVAIITSTNAPTCDVCQHY